MTTRVVGGTVVGANGVPIASAPIVIELVLAEAFVVTGSYSMGGLLRLQTAADGTWSTPLQCNDDLTPVGTLYQVTEKIPSGYGGAKCYLIQVLTSLSNSITNQVGALLVPAAVPVGGTYSPITVGPPGSPGTNGVDGFVAVADIAALNALTPKVAGRPIWVTSTGNMWVWNGSSYMLQNVPWFPTQGAADAAFNSISQHGGQPFYLRTGGTDEGPMWRNINNSYTRPWHMPWGLISYAPGGGGTQALSTTPLTFTTLTNTPLKKNRQYTFTGYWRAVICPGTAHIATPGTTIIAGTTLVVDHWIAVNGQNGGGTLQTMFTVSADGNYTIPIQASTSTGAGTLYLDSGAHIRIDDIGPSGAPQ